MLASIVRKRVIILALSLGLTTPTFADEAREFMMACTYGILAGTLVGAATLAFTKKPGENLRNVARGASIGLYTGILLGAYVIYGVDDGTPKEDSEGLVGSRLKTQRFALVPVLDDKDQLDGAVSQFNLLSF